MANLMQEELAQKLSLYFVAGTMNCEGPDDFKRIVKEAIDGGITTFQYREKGENAVTGDKQFEMALYAKNLCKENDVLFIVNDDLELMKAVDADGLHVGQTDGNLDVIRKETKEKILGISAHTLTEAKDAAERGADYVGVGPIFATSTKPDAEEPVGTGIFKELQDNGISIPLVAIGGISIENTSETITAGADGAAIISAITLSADPKRASKELLSIILKAKRG
ncbi:thiamine phosphate synthase [Bacillus sp. NEB1478]|uniref:thiamine phosphate synthase n=1 Tax=Bacillus sp. NEB1478 TaxID=3073816 RepID=UPI0028739829|nr:thiamine phosphate synthase [Bacillus sp. NEB1478]WNB90784.1 thiamine phosphate synthase [Bacillus sp. NEB1478]